MSPRNDDGVGHVEGDEVGQSEDSERSGIVRSGVAGENLDARARTLVRGGDNSCEETLSPAPSCSFGVEVHVGDGDLSSPFSGKKESLDDVFESEMQFFSGIDETQSASKSFVGDAAGQTLFCVPASDEPSNVIWVSRKDRCCSTF
jgi:hypothetical protein